MLPNKKKKLNILSAILLIGFSLIMYYHFILNGIYRNKGLDAGKILFEPSVHYTDLTDEAWNAKDLHPYVLDESKGERKGRALSMYFPFTYTFLLYPLSLLPTKIALGFFFIFFALTSLFANFYFLRWNNKTRFREESSNTLTSFVRNLFALSFLTYPFLFNIERANIEFFLFFFEILFLIFYLREKDYKASFFLSCAAAMKLYPGVFFFLFLKDKKYKAFFLGVGITLTLTLISLLLMEGSLLTNLQGLRSELQGSKSLYGTMDWPSGIYKGATLFGVIKTLFIWLDLTPITTPEKLFSIFTLFTVFVGLGLAYYFLKRENSRWKIVSLLTFSSILFNYTSFQYKLLVLFLPIWLFINTEEKSRFDGIYTVLFALMLIPLQNYLSYRGFSCDAAALLVPLMMLIFSGLILWEGLSPRIHDKMES